MSNIRKFIQTEECHLNKVDINLFKGWRPTEQQAQFPSMGGWV